MMKWLKVACILLTASPCYCAQWWISPTGNDSNSGATSALPKLTFSALFNLGGPGDTYNLVAGSYSDITNGHISDAGTSKSSAPANGTSTSNMTLVQTATIDGATVSAVNTGTDMALFLGTNSLKRKFIKFSGIKFDGGGYLYNTDHIYLRDCVIHSTQNSINAVMTLGTNNHDNGVTYNLMEQCLVYGTERLLILAFRTDHNVFRKILMRHDGCTDAGGTGCATSGNFIVGITLYNSSANAVQSSVNMDNLLGPNGLTGAADFQTAEHPSGDGVFKSNIFGSNTWRGDISINSQLQGFNMESNNAPTSTNTVQPVWTCDNIIVWNSSGGAFSNNNNDGSTQGMQLVLDHGMFQSRNNFTANNPILFVSGNMSQASSTVRDVVAIGSNTASNGTGITTVMQTSYTCVFGNFSGGNYGNKTCALGCNTTNPLNDGTPPSWKYVYREEAGSLLKGIGFNSQDIGATSVFQYGTDGTFWGDAAFETLTTTALWPWANDSTWQKDLQITSSRGCAAAGKSISQCIADVIGATDDPYGNAAPSGSLIYLWKD